MNTRSSAARTGLRRRLCLSNIAPNRSGAARALAWTLDSAAPAGVRSNLLRLLQPLARNRFIAGTLRNHGAKNNTPPSLLPVAPTPRAPALARRARNRFGATSARRAGRGPSSHRFGHAVGVPGSAYPEPYSRSPNGGGEGVNRYFPAGIESQRPREQPRLETEFVCAVRAPIRGGGGTPQRQGRDVGERGPTGGQRTKRRDERDVRAVGRRGIPRCPRECGRCTEAADSARNQAHSPCRCADVMASCVTTRGGIPRRRTTR
jgi:hypothetical protein